MASICRTDCLIRPLHVGLAKMQVSYRSGAFPPDPLPSYMEFKTFYRRHSPHYQQNEATYFVTTRLFGSLPREIIERLKDEHQRALRVIEREGQAPDITRFATDQANRRYFGRFDDLLNSTTTGPQELKIPEVAQLVADALHHRQDELYELICFCIMPNHFHLVYRIKRKNFGVHRVMQSLKQFTAKRINRFLNRTGPFWQDENYDRIVRDGTELDRIITYVLNNPVKAGLCQRREDWPHTYLNPTYA